MFDEVLAAAARLEGVAHRTPVVSSRTLDARVGARVHFKCENFQRMGAFKFRGAYNALSQLLPEQKKKGVVAFSSGNHAQAVALSGKLLGVPATIVMPTDAPKVKLDATRGYGADVVMYDAHNEDRQKIAEQLSAERGMTLIPPFDHPHIAAGQGTTAKELIEDAGPFDILMVPCGGGGLHRPAARSPPRGWRRTATSSVSSRRWLTTPRDRSTAARSRAVRNPPTIADGTRTQSVGKLNFELMRRYVDGMHTVSEEAIVDAVRFLFFRMKLVVEPSGPSVSRRS